MQVLRINTEHKEEIEFALQKLGCKVTGKRRRTKNKDEEEIEIEFPNRWSGSLSSAIYEIKGVKLLFGIGYPDNGIITRIHRWLFWKNII